MRQAKPDLRSKFPDQEGLWGLGQRPKVLRPLYFFITETSFLNSLAVIHIAVVQVHPGLIGNAQMTLYFYRKVIVKIPLSLDEGVQMRWLHTYLPGKIFLFETTLQQLFTQDFLTQ